MSDLFMNGNWMLDMLEKHIWHGFTVGAVALAIVYTVCKLFPKMPPDTTSWLYRLGYLKLITAFVFLRAISLTLPVYTPANPAPAVDTVIQISRHTSAVAASTARSAVHPNAVLYFLMLWGLVITFAGFRIAHASYKTRTLRKSCSVIQDAELHRILRDLCERMRIRRKPELLSGNVSGPMICGFLSPSIILPEGFSSEGIQLVLAHELAHVKRRDVMWAWLPMLAQWFFFFNPLVWLLRKEWLLAQEAACDAMAVDVTSASHAEYGRMLLTYVVPIPASRRLVAIGVSEPYNTLKRRLNAMLKLQSGSRKKNIIVGTIVLAIGIFASAFTVAGRTQLPTWAPKNPSPEFLRAAKVLKPLPLESNRAIGSLGVPVWECFGALTDQQMKDFMKIRQEKQKTDGMTQQTISYMKKNYGATERNGYIVYNKREISVPVKTMYGIQRKACDSIVESCKADLYKLGAAQDLSNVDLNLEFYANGCHEMRVSFRAIIRPSPTEFVSTSLGLGPFGYISR